jgi:diketogulonate reductase-like aldo/keto reductase
MTVRSPTRTTVLFIFIRLSGDDNNIRPKHESLAYKLDESEWSYVDTWLEMEKLPKDKARAIGVSNFSEKT